jgi:uncharacterized membrane protein
MNFTNMTVPNLTSTGMGGLIRFADDATGNMMGLVFIVGIIIITFLRQNGTFKQNIASSMFIGSMTAILFFILGIASEYLVLVVVILTALSMVVLVA